MSGAQHYREAEQIIATAIENLGDDQHEPDHRAALEDYRLSLALANVHATLALAAATAQGDAGVAPGDGQDRDAWDDALGGGAA